MRRPYALVPLLALAAFAEEGAIPFKLGSQGFEEGEARYRIERVYEGAVDGAAGTPDGKWLAWTSNAGLYIRGGDTPRRIGIPAGSRLLGCASDGRAVLAESLEAAPAVCAYDPAGGPRSTLFSGQAASLFEGQRLAGLLCVLGVFAVQENDSFTFYKLTGDPAGQAAHGSGAITLATFGARAIVLVPADGKPLLLSPDSPPTPLDPVLSGAMGIALSPDRPFIIASTPFDVGFVCLSTPGLRPLPFEGYTPLAWPSRSAILLSRPDGLYLLTLLGETPPDTVTDAEAVRRAAEERKRLEEADRARRAEEERQRLAEAERAKQEEERRRAEEIERQKQEEQRRIAEEERKRQEEAERATRETEQDIADFAGVGKARVGDLADAVKAALSEPDQREPGEEEGLTDWIYAARGLLLTFDDESKQLVRIQAMGKPDQLPVGMKDRFRPFRGKTGKGVSLGASRADIEAAYGTPAKVFTVGAAEMLSYDGDPARMSFHVERGKLVLIMVQRRK